MSMFTMTGNLTTVFQRFVLIISCTFIFGVTACQQPNNQSSTSTSANTENSGTIEPTTSLVASLLSWDEVSGLEAGAVITRLYTWAGLLFVEYEIGTKICGTLDIPDECYNTTSEHIIKQVGPGNWEPRSDTDAYVHGDPNVDFPSEVPLPIYGFTQFTASDRCIVVVASEDGVHFFEDGFGWQAWNEGLPNFQYKYFVYVPEETTLYVATEQDGLFKLNLSDVASIAASAQLPESERQCIHNGVTIQLD